MMERAIKAVNKKAAKGAAARLGEVGALRAELREVEASRDKERRERGQLRRQLAVVRGRLDAIGNVLRSSTLLQRPEWDGSHAGELEALKAMLDEVDVVNQVVEAARAECAKFRFAEEDRPELAEALAELERWRERRR
jgi:hypothetical protein